MKDITRSLNSASDFSSWTIRWKRNNALSVSPDVPKGFWFSYCQVHLKLQPVPSLVFFSNRNCIFSPLTEIALVFSLFISALRKFSGYETVIILTWVFYAEDKTWINVWFKIFSASTQAGINGKRWWQFERSVWQIPPRCPKLTSFSWCVRWHIEPSVSTLRSQEHCTNSGALCQEMFVPWFRKGSELWYFHRYKIGALKSSKELLWK